MESDRGENLNSEVEDPLPDYHEAKGTQVDGLCHSGVAQ